MGEPDFPVIWCDESLLAVNKPAGLPSLPDGYRPDILSLKDVLRPFYGELWIVHRLDRQTSGVIVLGRTAEAHRDLNTQFQDHQVTKIYHALVVGNPGWELKVIDLPLRPDGDRRHRTVVDLEAGKSALTRLRVLERFRGYCLVEARPETGRRHQIRAHLAIEGLPVIGDLLYGDGKPIQRSTFYEVSADDDRILLGRLGLHAYALTLRHPISHQELFLEASYPQDLVETLQTLRVWGR